jgi:predicted RNA binding protein YcfA (HicA-like mRNA interferase family)
MIMTNPATGHVAVVPDYGGREVPVGTLRGVLRQAGLTPREFIDLLD